MLGVISFPHPLHVNSVGTLLVTPFIPTSLPKFVIVCGYSFDYEICTKVLQVTGQSSCQY